ncbi:hypothetical protein ACFSJY_02810 [Thalassotalea euphylliae]|uniref:hypothetical protein n=1 Tax=Thalassotalea euphylliae TaxID=1655234 RepID=UPI0036436CE7
MKYLKIENAQAKFSINGDDWISIDQINKENLLKLVDMALLEDFQMDNPDEGKIGNDAHKIIYQNIYEKLSQLTSERKNFKDESESTYKDAIEKYTVTD